MKKIISVIVLIIPMMTSLLNAQIEWIKDESNPILVPGGAGQSVFVGHSSVLFHDGLYRMWYDGADNSNGVGVQTFYAYSEDGINWIKRDSGSVLGYGDTGEWDERNAYASEVIYQDSIYKMWYVSRNGATYNGKIGYAESANGINWVKYPGNPVMGWGDTGAFDGSGITYPSIQYYNGFYHMWYGGWNGSTLRLGYATSTDGIEWVRYEHNPVLNLGDAGEFDDTRIQKGEVLIINDEFHLWYTGRSSSIAALGYATSPDGINWTKYSGNPVMSPEYLVHFITCGMVVGTDRHFD